MKSWNHVITNIWAEDKPGGSYIKKEGQTYYLYVGKNDRKPFKSLKAAVKANKPWWKRMFG